ncbi:MAG: hypothetical protein QXD62_03545 [Candidatus Woesearchaeota archaeon]
MLEEEFLKKTPEGLIYVSKTLITEHIFDPELLEFYDYTRIIMLDKEKYEKLKNDSNYQKFSIFFGSEKLTEGKIKVLSLKNFPMAKCIEKGHIVYDLELSDDSDSLHVRRSNFNQVYAKQFQERNIILGISFDNLFLNDLIIGRIKQNLIIARQYKIPVLLSLFHTKHIFGWYEAMQFLRSLF